MRIALAVKTAFVCVASLTMAFTFLFVVIFRYGFNADLFAYEEWLLIICFWLYFMASAIGTYENSHVNADLLEYVLKNPKLRWYRSIAVVLIELIVCIFAIYWAVLMIQDEIDSYPYWQTTIALKIPFLLPRAAVLVGFFFMGFYSALRLYVLVKLGPAGERGLAAAEPGAAAKAE